MRAVFTSLPEPFPIPSASTMSRALPVVSLGDFRHITIPDTHFSQGKIHDGEDMSEAFKVIEIVEKVPDQLLTAKCMAEMRLKLVYDIEIHLGPDRTITTESSCTCMGGAEGRCKHVAAVLYDINNAEDTSPTSQECKWVGTKARSQDVHGKLIQGGVVQEKKDKKKKRPVEEASLDELSEVFKNCSNSPFMQLMNERNKRMKKYNFVLFI